MHIPEIYFSIASWKELLYNEKIIIDSFSVVRPDLQIYGLKKNQSVESKPFHPTDLLIYLEQARAPHLLPADMINFPRFLWKETGKNLSLITG
jgi:hypothetical protein